jgi:hypothetical protein
MSDLMTILSHAISGGALQSISRTIGANSDETSKAIAAAIPILVGALDRNTDHPAGADALARALQRDHDGSILDDLGAFLGSGKFDDGADILGHVLGGKRQSVETGLSKASGLDMGSVAKLLPILAPIVLGAVGRMQRQQRLDPSGLSNVLAAERRRALQAHPQAMGALESLLDTNHDGQVIDDVVKIGSSLLDSFMRKA